MLKKRFIFILVIVLLNVIFISKIFAFDDKNIISVKDYGAKGDGKTDDLKAIKKAINVCDEKVECTVYFPNGNYVVSDSVIISKSNIRLLGGDNVTIKYGGTSSDIDSNHTVGVIVVKTIDRDVSNVVIDNLIVDVGASDTKYGKKDSLGRGITFIRQGKYKGTKNYYLMNDVKIVNSTIKNAYSYGIAVVGGEQLKDGYTTDSFNEIKKDYSDDFDYRLFYNYYDIENLTISGCKVDKSRIGIRINRVNNGILSNNEVSNSRLENITIQGQNINISDNKLYEHNGGCGSLCIDKSDDLNINGNYIDDSKSSAKDVDRIGICQNSSAGPSYNVIISGNNIKGSSRGIWLKNHLLSADPNGKGNIGSRPGAAFLIKDNKIEGSSITDIRIDELLDRRIDNNAYVGKSYLYNKYSNTVNKELYSNSEVGANVSLDDNKIDVIKPSIIKVGKIDKKGNYISGAKLQVKDSYGNVYNTFESKDGLYELDLLLGSYILVELDSNNDEAQFSVENDNYQRKYIYIIDKNSGEINQGSNINTNDQETNNDSSNTVQEKNDNNKDVNESENEIINNHDDKKNTVNEEKNVDDNKNIQNNINKDNNQETQLDNSKIIKDSDIIIILCLIVSIFVVAFAIIFLRNLNKKNKS